MRSNRIILWLVLTDGVGALLALWAASGLSWMSKGPGLSVIESSAPSWLLGLLLVWVLVCDRMQLSQFYPHRTELIARLIVATTIEGMSVVVLNLVLGAPLPSFRTSTFVAVFFANVSILRLVRRAIYARGHLGPVKRHRAVIIGSGPLARE